MSRAKNLATATALVVAVIAIPVLLVALTGSPIPAHPSLQAVADAFTTRDDGSNFLHIIVWLGWIAWAYFTIALVLEAVSQLRESRQGVPLVVPGFGGARGLLAPMVSVALGLVIAGSTTVTPALAATPQAAPVSASATTQRQAAPSPSPSAAGQASREQQSVAVSTSREDSSEAHYVVRGDGEALWSIAEHFYGDGAKWTTIAQANPEVVGADGHGLLSAGDVLVIPDATNTTAAAATSSTPAAAPSGFTSHTVTSTDTLRGLAEQYLGSADRWHEIYAASTSITQADGQHLSDPDVIVDGWILHIPATRTTTTPAPSNKTTTAPSSSAPVARQDDDPNGTTPTSTASAPATSTTTGATAAAAASAAASTTASASASTAPATSAPATSATATTASTTAGDVAPAAPLPVDTSEPSLQTSASADPTAAAQPTATEHNQVTPRGLEAIGGVLAVCLLGIIGSRCRRQAARRRPGQRVPAPNPEQAATITALQHTDGPLTTAHLDRALRTLSAALADQQRLLPPLLAVRLDDARIDLILAEEHGTPPAPFTATSGRVWSYLPGAEPTTNILGIAAPYPALVTLGRDADNGHLLVDLETLGALAISDQTPAEIIGVLALELATSTWADDLAVTLVGAYPDLPAALDSDRLRYVPDMDQLITQLEHHAADTTQALDDEGLSAARDGRLGDDTDTWTPHVILVATDIDDDTATRLGTILTDHPRVSIAAVTTDNDGIATLEPLGLTLTPQRLTNQAYDSITNLSIQSQSTNTEPAPWWDHSHHAARPAEDDNDDLVVEEPTQMLPAVTTTQDLSAHRQFMRPAAAQQPAPVVEPEAEQEPAAVVSLHQPMIRLLGEVRIENVDGNVQKRRAGSEVFEPITFVHLNPGAPTKKLAAAMGSHTSNPDPIVSRARAFMGTTSEGEKLFPTAARREGVRTYSLHPSVTSDWALLNSYVGDKCKVNTAPTKSLWRALELVEGRPLETVAPGRWPWIENLRSDMIDMIVDIAHEAADRAIAKGDPERAVWAITKGHLVDPTAEVLERDELRVCVMTGKTSAAQDVIDRILATCASLQMDPDPETMEIIHSIQDTVRRRARA